MKLRTVAAVVGAFLALIAITNLPYGYYTFARIAITAISVILIVFSVRAGVGGWLFGLIPVAILWNPIIPVYLSRGAWLPLDLLATAFFLCFAIFTRTSFGTGSLQTSEPDTSPPGHD